MLWCVDPWSGGHMCMYMYAHVCKCTCIFEIVLLVTDEVVTWYIFLTQDLVITVPADGLAPNVARPSAGKVLITQKLMFPSTFLLQFFQIVYFVDIVQKGV